MSKIDSFHSYLRATKDMAQSVVHRYHTCDEEPNVAWEIIEDIMEGLIAVFLDMFGEEEKTKPVDDVVVWKDFKELQRELGQVSEANMTNFVSINQALDKIDMLTDRLKAIEEKIEGYVFE